MVLLQDLFCLAIFAVALNVLLAIQLLLLYLVLFLIETKMQLLELLISQDFLGQAKDLSKEGVT